MKTDLIVHFRPDTNLTFAESEGHIFMYFYRTGDYHAARDAIAKQLLKRICGQSETPITPPLAEAINKSIDNAEKQDYERWQRT